MVDEWRDEWRYEWRMSGKINGDYTVDNDPTLLTLDMKMMCTRNNDNTNTL